MTSKVNETLIPKLNRLPGFAGYYLIEAGNGVCSSLSLFETTASWSPRNSTARRRRHARRDGRDG